MRSGARGAWPTVLAPVLGPVLALGVALAASACGPASLGRSAPPSSIDPTAPVVTARDLAFDRSEIAAPADRAFSIVFQNADGVPHNIAIYADSSLARSLFVGEIFIGPATRAYDLPPLASGSYFFRCDVHPDMQGRLLIAGAG
ncbi:MAG TPA: cupredoxin domain-containing protein [Candidatus Eisenbacteria bacterium]|nr:cupredoxin domain-containing protein [Candidatus Eisenbacteria bacterium]